MKAIFVRTALGLKPASEEAERVCACYAIGDEVLIEHVRGRNARNHRRFFAFVNATFQWQDTYEEKEIWRKVLELNAGHFDVVMDMRGKTHFWPRSIAWDKIEDEHEFQDLFGRVVNGYLRKYGGTLTAEQVDRVARF